MKRLSIAVWLVASSAVALPTGCSLLNEEVACERDQDCPTDAGISFCTSWTNRGDAGEIGTCTGDEDFEGDFKFDAGADAGVPMVDGGAPDGGGGPPGS